MLGLTHLADTWQRWEEERVQCLWCLGTLDLERGLRCSLSHRCQMLAALGLTHAYHAQRLLPMGTIFDIALPPSERVFGPTRISRR